MLKQELKPTTQQAEAPKCKHHWVIEPASGPFSKGKCRICGESREFRNYLEETPWSEVKAFYTRARTDVLTVEVPREDEGMD
jgi:hypothetical protein